VCSQVGGEGFKLRKLLRTGLPRSAHQHCPPEALCQRGCAQLCHLLHQGGAYLERPKNQSTSQDKHKKFVCRHPRALGLLELLPGHWNSGLIVHPQAWPEASPQLKAVPWGPWLTDAETEAKGRNWLQTAR
jgi:hypothetical protein